MCPCVSVCASACIRGCGGALEQVGFQCQKNCLLFRKSQVFLGSTGRCFICFHFKDVFPKHHFLKSFGRSWVWDSQLQVQGEGELPGRSLQTGGSPRGVPIEVLPGSREKKTETRTLHRKTSPLSSDWKLMSKNFNLSCQTVLVVEEGIACFKFNRVRQVEWILSQESFILSPYI